VLDSGLLEQSILVLVRSPTGEWSFHAVSGQAVGFASSGRRRSFLRWWSWGRLLWGVHETQDRPLVFTVRRCWGIRPWYEIRDAETRRVGLLLGRLAWDRLGRRVALRVTLVEQGTAGRIERFLQPDGTPIAELEWSGAEGRLGFLLPGSENPFTRMLLLAAALLSR
jgi:hypothetical protein